MEITRRSLKDWTRWTTISKEFPKPKYGFSALLKKKGDYIVTHPMTYAEYQKIKDAAKFWARFHDCRVTIRSLKVEEDKREVTIMLVEKHRLELPHGLQRGPEKYL
jgi:hypothetical protein